MQGQRANVETFDGRSHDLLIHQTAPQTWKARRIISGRYVEGVGESAREAVKNWIANYQATFPCLVR
jgi:hypothetical protein